MWREGDEYGQLLCPLEVMATIEQLIDRVRTKTMVGTSELADTGMILWFNDAADEISNRFDNPWLVGVEDIVSVAAQASYTPAADIVSIIAIVVDGETGRLVPVTRTEVLQRYGDAVPSGTPKFYYLWDGDIYFLPTPDAAKTYHINLIGLPVLFTATTDEPAMLASFHNVLADYVEARVWEREEEFEKALQAQSRFEMGVRSMRLAYQSQTNRQPWALGDGRPAVFNSNTPFGEDWGIA